MIDTGQRIRWAHWGHDGREQIPGTRAHVVSLVAHVVSLVVHFALIGFSL